MKIIKFDDLIKSEREVHCPKGDFISFRYLLEADGMGFTLTKTFIPKGLKKNIWHYKNHFEACYCLEGEGIVSNLDDGASYKIVPGTVYALDKHDRHLFRALEDTTLLCVFNPPLKGKEVHNDDGTYSKI